MTNRIPFLPGASRSEAQKFTMNFSAKWSINSQKVRERGRGRENWAQKQIRPDQTSNLTEQTERNHIHRPKTVGGVLMSMQRAACNMGQDSLMQVLQREAGSLHWDCLNEERRTSYV